MEDNDPALRQCMLCTPQNPDILPGHLKFNPATEVLLIATQTCSLSGPGAEPTFEIAVASLLENHDPDHDEARGKRTRYLMLEVSGDKSVKGCRLDASRRALLPRELLSVMSPRTEGLPSLAEKLFRGWIARYYSRIAWPDALGNRLEKRKFRKTIQGALNEKLMDGRTPYVIRSDVYAIYMHWSPEHQELPGSENYVVSVLIVCGKRQTQDHLLKRLSGMASGVKEAPLLNGLVMDDPDVKLATEVTHQDTRDMHVYTAFDDLT